MIGPAGRVEESCEKPRQTRLFAGVTISRTKVMRKNYQSACPWDIYSLRIADEMVG